MDYGIIRKLQTAINTKGEMITYHTSQFYSKEQNRPVTKYTIMKADVDEDTGRTVNREIYSTYSHIRVVLFLRDYWFKLNGIPLPQDNKMWNELRPK